MLPDAMTETTKPADAEYVETQAAELTELSLPDEADLTALRELTESMGKGSSDARVQAAIGKGLLKDLAPCFDPETRAEAPGRHNSISATIVADFAELLRCFDAAAAALGCSPPAPNQRRYKGPELRLRYCRIDQCDLSMRPVHWPLHLCGCQFRGAGMFMGVTFAARAGFEHSAFESGADFGLARFQGDASFSSVVFAAHSMVSATFAGVTFCRHADFDLARFAAGVQFDYGNFESQTRFFRSTFEGPGGFVEANFHAEAQFEFASFQDGADFNGVTFQKAPDFHQASFKNVVDFSNSNFEEYLDLRGASFDPEASLNLADLRIRASSVLGGNVRLRTSQLRAWHWWPPGMDSLIETDNARKIRTAARRRRNAAVRQGGADGRNRAEQTYRRALGTLHESLISACAQYGVLEENFRAQGDPDSRGGEDFCHYRYHDLWRQTHRRWYNPLCWTNWFFLKICIGYGVFPARILLAGIALIVLFAALYATAGFGVGGAEWDVCGQVVTDEPAVSQTADGHGGPGGPNTITVRLSELHGWRKWARALYFSTMTWTTVGYGDWSPVGRGAQIAAATEAMLGVFITAVFTVCFARKFVR